MSCDNHGATIKVADLDSSIGTEALKIIPFPEPGLWYIGFQLDCRNTTTGDLISCPESSVSAMVSVDVNIQPCDYRPLQTGINLILVLLIFIWISVYYTFLYTQKSIKVYNIYFLVFYYNIELIFKLVEAMVMDYAQSTTKDPIHFLLAHVLQDTEDGTVIQQIPMSDIVKPILYCLHLVICVSYQL